MTLRPTWLLVSRKPDGPYHMVKDWPGDDSGPIALCGFNAGRDYYMLSRQRGSWQACKRCADIQER